MGYSHYLERPRELELARWREWVGDVRQIISNLPAQMPVTYYPMDGLPTTVLAPLIVTGPKGNVGQPALDDSRVAFNGGGWVGVGRQPQRLWCESFWLGRVLDPIEAYGPADKRGWYFECCKTRRQPYDLAVTASLLRLAHRFPEGVEGRQRRLAGGLAACARPLPPGVRPRRAAVRGPPVGTGCRT